MFRGAGPLLHATCGLGVLAQRQSCRISWQNRAEGKEVDDSKLLGMTPSEYLRRLNEIQQTILEQDAKKAAKQQREDKKLAAASKWVEKPCRNCKAKFSINLDWKNPPVFCAKCRKDIDRTYVPDHRKPKTRFTHVSLVQGGAPGLGKRS